MNLYLFNANVSAARYGIGTYLKELTLAMEGADVHLHIVHLHSSHRKFEIEKTNHVENWYVPEVQNHNTYFGSVQNLEDYCRNVIYLLRLHIRDTKDLVFHFNFSQYPFLAKELKAIFNCKTVNTVHYTKWALKLHGNLSQLHAIKKKSENQRSSFEQLLYSIDEYEGLFYKEVDRIIVLSQYAQSHLCSEYRINLDKITVIPNGPEDASPLMETDRDVLRRKWLISGKESVILFTGRLQSVKGLPFLIKSFRKVLEKIPDCRLMIVGNGEFDIYMKECEDVWTHVTWTGLLSKDKLYELYSIADMGVMPSFHEQCSYVAIEMMMHRLPLIASTSTGLKEMVEDEKTGLHIPVIEYDDNVEIDTDLLAEKILYLLQHPDERQRMGQNARKRYEEQYSMEVFRKNMLDFYHSLFE